MMMPTTSLYSPPGPPVTRGKLGCDIHLVLLGLLVDHMDKKGDASCSQTLPSLHTFVGQQPCVVFLSMH
ncbi:hypothetical protein HanRHA438_Chr10g0448781 [Helianthus annuus]|nr:hypothetical protein HanRHA438_Chr10g0448781 [Helianthus annuus]